VVVKNHQSETGGLFLTARDSTVLGITCVTTGRRPVESLDLNVVKNPCQFNKV